ncbi:amidohydrolase family protein [Pseudoduganella sp. FT93W]|uniref:Amidohydrolase family protein n=1 Tax=Duganella fentianensis TaxID=2692177 RepID=A0A845HUM5_9BURK|nr:amidohydrolase family protein [Duganella fentianensis]MYN44750.1 amidohydrolase family protein [Duganella fentianensis]
MNHVTNMTLACDSHVHVFDPARFPYVLPRSYTPATASVRELRQHLHKLGMARVVLIQPSPYGTDNRCLLDALQQLGCAQARAIAVIDADSTTPLQLENLHQQGVRGVRLNVEAGSADAVSISAALRQTAEKVAPLGWLIQLYADGATVAALAPMLATLPCRVILDHFGGMKSNPASRASTLPVLLDLLASGNVYIKLSAPYRVARDGPDYASVAELAGTLINAAPHRLLWGSDWPHTGSSAQRDGNLARIEAFRAEDATRTLSLLSQWARQGAQRDAILIHNPAALFGFAI